MYDIQINEVKKGLNSNISSYQLNIYNWNEFKEEVCGSQKVNIELLMRNTKYSRGYTNTSKTIKIFWEAFSQLKDNDQRGFIRFAWGRSILPKVDNWSDKLELIKVDRSRAILAHSCFFQVELPELEDLESMKILLIGVSGGEGFNMG